MGWQGSGDLAANARANCYAVLPDGRRSAGGGCDYGAAAVGFLADGSEKLSHYDEAGQAHMVDVSAKAATRREAVAEAFVELSEAVLAALPENPKGNPLEVARFAGIQAAKQTAALIPMCHPLALSFVDVEATVVAGGVRIEATAATTAATGVEMEAMVAASVAALTVYDMTKALDKGIRIREVELVSKSGGKSGEWRRG